MSQFTIYDPATGQVLRHGEAPDDQIEAQVQPGEALLQRAGRLGAYLAEAGVLLDVPPRPSQAHRFDWTAKAWFDDRTASQRSEQALAGLRAERDRKLAETDWRVLRALEQGAAPSPEWRQYRQALRDVTLQPDPEAIDWPKPPNPIQGT